MDVRGPAAPISADEIALYDRQIRLWGVKAQEKLRSANILLISIKALANEVAKNLVLAGIGSLTIVDHETVTEEDLAAQFFVSEEHLGMNRAVAAGPQIRAMNPRVQVHVDSEDVRAKPAGFFARFDVTIATELDFQTYTTINAACRASGARPRPFYAAGVHGLYGYVFADLVSHDFVIERVKSNVRSVEQQQETPTRRILSIATRRQNDKLVEMVTKRETYSPLWLAQGSPLPHDLTRLPRKRRQVTPLLPCLRALWEFQKRAGSTPVESVESVDSVDSVDSADSTHTNTASYQRSSSLPDASSRADRAAFTELATTALHELQLDPAGLPSAFILSFLDNLGCELSPVAAFVGGTLAQDVINVLGAREQPLQNLLLFDADRALAPIYPLHPLRSDAAV